jgi:MoaA/NifB/PqqE/SkfB family radical SAM enzyme
MTTYHLTTTIPHFALAPGVKYRRESFGGIVFQPENLNIRFFNHSAAWVIEQFAVPTKITSIEDKVKKIMEAPCDISALISNLLDNGIVKEVSESVNNIGRVFFTHITDFSTDRLHAPLGVECELTLRCMRRCIHCANDSSPDIPTSGELTQDDWTQILTRLSDDGVFYVCFTGGDPLTRRDSIAIAKTASDLGFGVFIASDLTVLSKRDVADLASLKNLLYIKTSLDGANPKVADCLRGSGSFREVLRGLNLLQEAKVPVVVGTIVTKLNANTIGETAKLLSKYDNVIGYWLSPLYDAGRAQLLRELVPSSEDLSIAYEQFAEAVNKGLVRPGDSAWEPLAAPASSEQRRTFWADQPNLVRSPDRFLRIDPLGRACVSIRVKSVLGEEVYVGDVMRSTVIDLWHNSTVLNFLRSRRRKHPYLGDVVDIADIHELKGGV